MHEDDRREPLCAVYSKKAYVLMEDFISKRQYGLLRFADAAGCRLLDCNKLGFYHPRQFVNVNTITDFDLLNQS
jgi:molybdopterin-guanine dinucleotide biosynthesis protein A